MNITIRTLCNPKKQLRFEGLGNTSPDNQPILTTVLENFGLNESQLKRLEDLATKDNEMSIYFKTECTIVQTTEKLTDNFFKISVEHPEFDTDQILDQISADIERLAQIILTKF
jgi:hypothetical protein